MVAVDLNADGKLDLVSNGHADLSVLMSQGDGTFHTVSYAGVGFASIPADLNGDANTDLVGLIGDSVVVLLSQSTSPFSLDTNHNSIPDECETLPSFHRGDPNSSGTTDISDAIAVFGFLFLGDVAPKCNESADVNNDATIDISDGIFLLSWLFNGGPEPVPPGPAGIPCGLDVDPPDSPGDLGCDSYDHCDF